MRKKIKDYLARAMFERLGRDHRELRKLDPKKEDFNGTFGFALGETEGTYYFLTVIAHDSEDTFRALLAWGPKASYPALPFNDITASQKDYLLAPSAEIQLAHLLGGEVPYVFALDREAQAGAAAREAISQRLQRGETVSPEEWVLTLQSKQCSFEEAMAEADLACSEVALAAMRGVQLRTVSG